MNIFAEYRDQVIDALQALSVEAYCRPDLILPVYQSNRPAKRPMVTWPRMRQWY